MKLHQLCGDAGCASAAFYRCDECDRLRCGEHMEFDYSVDDHTETGRPIYSGGPQPCPACGEYSWQETPAGTAAVHGVEERGGGV